MPLPSFVYIKQAGLYSARLEDEDQGDDDQDSADGDNYPHPQWSRSGWLFRRCFWWSCFSLEAEGS